LSLQSALYSGRVTHTRKRPRLHRLNYRVFWLWIDLEEIDGLDKALKVFSRNRFNLLSFNDRDYGDGTIPLRERVIGLLAEAGVDLGNGTVRLLTMPRVLGFVFNPISIYYGFGPDGRLAGMVYEVTSTFGIRHSYVLPVAAADAARGVIRQGARKALYVSPFMDMEMDYAFHGHAPGETVDLTVVGSDSEGVLITAGLQGNRSDLTDRALLSAALTVPLMTLKVVAAIHWEALKLFLKGVRLTRQPAPPATAASIQKLP
jgi:DUF1365 family protein